MQGVCAGMSRVLRCAACTKRIKVHHPHIGVEDLEAGREFYYHARCREALVRETASRLERGKVYVLHHYHSSRCPDKAPSWGCSGGCFDTPSFAAVAN